MGTQTLEVLTGGGILFCVAGIIFSYINPVSNYVFR